MRFVNQLRIKNEVDAIIEYFRYNKEGINILLQGPAGCGKTSLAKIICKKVAFEKYAYTVPTGGDVSLNDIIKYRVIFIDEIHELREFEPLYPYMDSGEHVFLFCTTEYGNLPEPFQSRCVRFTFDNYDISDLTFIVCYYAGARKFPLPKQCCELIAQSSRGSPRIAKQLFDRVKLMLSSGHYRISPDSVASVLNRIGIYKSGYTAEDFKYLSYLEKVGSSSVDNLCRVLKLDLSTVKREVEPFLLEHGNILVTSKGRKFITWGIINQT